MLEFMEKEVRASQLNEGESVDVYGGIATVVSVGSY